MQTMLEIKTTRNTFVKIWVAVRARVFKLLSGGILPPQ
jgi:hypothetical protein